MDPDASDDEMPADGGTPDHLPLAGRAGLRERVVVGRRQRADRGSRIGAHGSV